MSLISSLQMAGGSLNAAQIGLQVVGNNIANANTPGYIRAEVILTPGATQRLGGLLLGTGVDVLAIVQMQDKFLEERLRSATSDASNGQAQEQAYMRLESVIGELSDTDLSTSLTSFFGSINDILNQPESISIRNLAVLQGETLTQDIQRLSSRVRTLRKDANDRVIALAADINRLTQEVAALNIQVVLVEAGDASSSDAVGLRDQRGEALRELASILDIRTVEQPTGSVTVFNAGEFLVADGNSREVTTEASSDGGLVTTSIKMAQTDRVLDVSSGELAGLISARDEIFGSYLDSLDNFAKTLSFEFNKIYSTGQGLNGFKELESEFSVTSVDVALDQAGLDLTPVNGGFQVKVTTTQGTSVSTKTYDIDIDLNGLGNDTTLEDVRATLDAIDGLTASISSQNRLLISSDSPNVEFAFAPPTESEDHDTSGLLAALGLGTFFTGSNAMTMNVSQVAKADPSKFAVSRGGIGEDSENAATLAGFLDRDLDLANGMSLAVLYDRLVSETTQGAGVAGAVAEGFKVFQQTLEAQKMAISGVNIDEEAVKMLTYQRAYQATARYIATIGELLDVLVNI